MNRERDPWPLLILIAIVIFLWAYGCKQLSAGEKGRQRIQASLSKLRETKVLSAPGVPKALSATAPAGLRQVSFEWSNSQAGWTGIEGSTNCLTWTVLLKVWGEAGPMTAVLHDRPAMEFYRAFSL